MTHAVPSPAEYKDVLLFLATAGVVVPLFSRLKISPVLGFLVAGVALGPSGLGALAESAPWLSYLTITDAEQARVLGELGVVFLLFTIGLELSWERLRRMRKLIFGFGALQIALCGAVLWVGGYLLGARLGEAAAIAAALALSSTAVVIPLLAEQRRLQIPAGRATFGALLAQDLAVAPLLLAVAFVAGGEAASSGSPWLRLGVTLASAVVGLGLLIVVGRMLMRPMLRSVARADSREMFFAACLLVVILAGLAAQLAGLSMALGAFVAGLLLAETEFRREVEVTVEPFKGLLLGLFFVSVGLSLDIGVLLETPGTVAALLVGSVLLKAAIVFGLARLFGLRSRQALETALALAPAGEFAFVILGQTGGARGPLTEAALVAVTLSMFAIPLLTRLGARLGREPDSEAPTPAFEAPDEDDQGRVIVAGYGRVGKLVGEMLAVHETPWIAVDNDVKTVAAARKDGVPIFYGDASRPEFLEVSGIAKARAVVLTMSSSSQVDTVVKLIRERWPDQILIARARDARHAARLYELGVTDAVPETVEASLQLAENTLVDIGVPMGPVIASIHERREQFRDLFRAKIEGDREPRALGSARAARHRAKAETSSQETRPVEGEA